LEEEPVEYNLADLFESIVDTVPDREALVCDPHRLTYAELEGRANQLAHHLAAVGVRAGDHVGTQMYNGREYVETILACLKLRAVPININYRYVEAELAHLYGDADLVAVVFDSEFAPRVEAAAPAQPSLRHFIAVGTTEGPLPGGTLAYEDALAAQKPIRDFPARSADDHYIIYTGGTTGMPKGVVWRQEDLFFAGMGGGDPTGQPISRPEELAERAATAPQINLFPVAPLMHGASQLGTFIGFNQARKVVLVRRFDAVEVVRTISREQVNAVSIVGDAMARPMAEAIAGPLKGIDLSSWFAMSSAGAILSQSVRDALIELLPNLFILDNFGASETGFNGTGIAGSSPEAGLRFTVNARTAVLDDDMRPLPPGSPLIGRVAQRGHIPLGYYKDKVRTAETFVESGGERWVLLGDRAQVEADGTVHVLGRDSVCINTGGEKVFTEEVEAGLKAHPAVFDAVVAGIPDQRYGERVAAVVQFRPDVPRPTDEELDAHCRARVAGYKVPRLFVPVQEVRRSPSGKADYPWAKETVTAAANVAQA
jgi:acyl-CoA synthetase (AMP-forming)/AMP-acid ligase II